MANENVKDSKEDGEELLDKGEKLGTQALKVATTVGGALAAPIKAAAGYQAIVRDIAMKARVAGQPGEALIANSVATSARGNGIGRDVLGQAVGKMVGDGVEHGKALQFAPVLAQFSVGQKVAADETAALVAALNQQAGITDAAGMKTALGAIAEFGKANNIDRADLAKELPAVLERLSGLGLSGQEAVARAAALLKKQLETDGDPAEAARNVKLKLAALDKASKKDGGKAARAELAKAAPPASLAASNDVLKEDQAAVLGTSEQKWEGAGRSTDEAMRKIGDAVRPLSDSVAGFASEAADGVGDLAQAFPRVTQGVLAVGAALAAAATAAGVGVAAYRVVKGGLGMLRGKAGADDAAQPTGRGAQKVYVTNWPANKGWANGPDGAEGKGKKKKSGNSSGNRAGNGRNGGAAGGRSGAPRPAGGRAGLLGRAWSGVRGIAGRAGPMLGRTVGAFRSAAPLVRVGAGLGVVGAVVRGAQLATTLVGDGARYDKAKAIGGAASMAIGGTLGLVLGPLGAAAGMAVADKMWSKWGDSVLKLAPSSLTGSAPESAQPAAAGPARGGSQATSQATSQAGSGAGLPAAAALAAGASGVAASAAAARPSPAAPPSAPIQVNFNPSISVTVQGDVREPRRIAEELMPHLRQMFEAFNAQTSRAAIFDPHLP